MSTQSEESSRLVCGRCGSSATHQVVMGMPPLEFAEQVVATPWQRLGGCLIVPGMWTAECLTCGQRETVEGERGDFTEVPAPDMTVARAVTGYAARCREALGQATASVVSHAGLWLLLASVAEHVSGEERAGLEEVLGMPAGEAVNAAQRLLAEQHPTLAAAAGAWAAADAVTPVGVERPIPDQATLDAWASTHTRGLVERFPVEVSDLTRVLLATALVLEPQWTDRMETSGRDGLVLNDGLQTIVATNAAGLVVVAKPHSSDGVDVVSVRAHPRTQPAQVWQAVDEVVSLLNDGALWHGERSEEAGRSGHSWRSRTARITVTDHERASLPTDSFGRPRQWRSKLRKWTAQESLDLTEAPGVSEVAAALTPEEPGAAAACLQTVRAEYDADGFRAAAVTVMDRVGSAPNFDRVEVERVDLDFRGPHAVVAVARGGAWEGVPLVSAWVGGDNRTDLDGEALELLADTGPEQAGQLRDSTLEQMGERGEAT